MRYARIVVDPARMGGLPTIRNTRVTVAVVLGQLAAGRSIDQILSDYPYGVRPPRRPRAELWPPAYLPHVEAQGNSSTADCSPRSGQVMSRPGVMSKGAPIVIYLRGIHGELEEAEHTMPEQDKKYAAHRALVDRILNGPGTASAEQRARAFDNDGPSPVNALIGKVATGPAQVTAADYTAAKALGFSEDQLFELVVCAVVGQSARLYEAGLAALAETSTEGQ